MAEIELAPLSHRLDDEEIKLLGKRLKDLGVSGFERGDDSSGHTVAFETFLRISGEMPEILIDTIISPGQAWQTAPAGAPLVSGLPPDIVGRPP